MNATNRGAVMAAAVTLTLACAREPDESLFIVGRITDVDHAPVAGFPVTLLRNGSADCLTQFYGRPAEVDAGTFSELNSTTTNARGDFLFELTVRDARPDLVPFPGMAGGACFRARAEHEGAVSEARFVHTGEDVELRDLPLSNAVVRMDGTGFAVEGEWVRDPTIDDWVVRSGAESAWHQDADGGTALFAPESLEDFTDLTVTRRSITGARQMETLPLDTVQLVSSYVVETAPVPFTNPAPAAPVSRAEACDAGICGLSDGRLERVSLRDAPSETPGMPPSELTVVLSRQASPREVVVRGLEYLDRLHRIVIEGAADEGAAWTPLGEFVASTEPVEDAVWVARTQRERGDYLRVPVTAAAPVRLVRLRAEVLINTGSGPSVQPMPLFAIQELSVFE